jgi:hypothetical protein
MQSLWYYSRDGALQGPFSEEQMEDFAGRKLLRETDLVWRQNSARDSAVPAKAFFHFGSESAPASALPDWLADVELARLEPRQPLLADPPPNHEDPEWLEDLRLWVGLEVFIRAKDQTALPGEITLSAPAHTEVPDWLENWNPPAKPKASPLPPASAPVVPTPPVPKPALPIAPVATPVVAPVVSAPVTALPVPKSPPSMAPVATLVSAPTIPAPPLATPVPKPPPLVTPVAPRVSVPTESAPPAPKPPPSSVPLATPYTAKTAPDVSVAARAVAERLATLAEKMRDESGFDAETGRVLDPVKFRQWQKKQALGTASGQPGTSNASILELFRKSRHAIEAWVDEETNCQCVLHAELDDIRKLPAIVAIIQEGGKFGKELQEKLLHHLAFMVNNRRKYYQAVTEQGG